MTLTSDSPRALPTTGIMWQRIHEICKRTKHQGEKQEKQKKRRPKGGKMMLHCKIGHMAYGSH